ncbi:MAG: response regulator [Alphaproteobacteria bacterium]|nr:response regulator [Alphaproteobacteria bacterium]MCB9699706.1 response regulator [Alphaproteobacteria bacterium]
MKVLLVDDEADIRRIAELSLRNLGGHEVVAASSGAEALASVEGISPDVVLMDVTMPDLDGLAVLAEVRRRGLAVPVVFMTARVQPSDRERYLSAGAVGVIEKPFDPMTLHAALRRIVGG